MSEKDAELSKFTLLAFYHVKTPLPLRQVDLNPIVARLETDAVQVDRGVFVLRSHEDREVIAEAVQALQTLQLPFALARFGRGGEGVRLELHTLQKQTLKMQEWGYS